jgi:hypothetical protein
MPTDTWCVQFIARTEFHRHCFGPYRERSFSTCALSAREGFSRKLVLVLCCAALCTPIPSNHHHDAMPPSLRLLSFALQTITNPFTNKPVRLNKKGEMR